MTESGLAGRDTLAISEIFYSLQGEGVRRGRPCLFIRLLGCNLSCAWCDTPYTWKPGHVTVADRATYAVTDLLALAAEQSPGLVEITGGEPLLQRGVHDLMTGLCDAGQEVLLDTGGGASTAGVDPRVVLLLDLKCPSSGQAEKMVWDNLDRLRQIDEVKFVIADRADYEWACDVIARYDLYARAAVLFSPVTPLGWVGDLTAWPLRQELADWMLADRSRATLQLQLHRLLWPRAVRGTEEHSAE